MTNLWTAVASLVEKVAEMGAGAASSATVYEPEVPEELKK